MGVDCSWHVLGAPFVSEPFLLVVRWNFAMGKQDFVRPSCFNLIDSFHLISLIPSYVVKKKGIELFLKLSVHSPTERCSTYISLKIILHTHF